MSEDDDESGECLLPGRVSDNPSAVEVLLKLLLTDKSSGISWTNPWPWSAEIWLGCVLSSEEKTLSYLCSSGPGKDGL